MQTDTMPRVDPAWGDLIPVDGAMQPLPFTSSSFHVWGLRLRAPYWALAWESSTPAPKASEAPPTVMGWGHGWTWAIYYGGARPRGGRIRQIPRAPDRLVLLPGSILGIPPTPGYFWAELGEQPIWTQTVEHAIQPGPVVAEHHTRQEVDREVEAYLAANPHAGRMDVYRALHRTQLSVRASLNRLGYRVPGR